MQAKLIEATLPSGAPEPSPAAVSLAELGALSALDRASLQQLWARLWQRPAPRRASRALLIYALAYRIQPSALRFALAGKR